METRKNNPELKPYVENFIIEKLENCELFVKTYGRGFARERLRINFKRLYTDEISSKNAGECSFTFKSITLFSKGEDGNLLTSNDIELDDDLQDTIVHEGIHAIFSKTKKECKALKILDGSGIHYNFSNKDELGRGLNEGFTNWVCIKAGMSNSSYSELTNIVNLLEMALGEEKVMQFAKGDIEHNLSSLLNMTTEACVNFLAKCDSLYNYNDKASDYRIAGNALNNAIAAKEENSDDISEALEELNNNYLYRRLPKDKEYLEFAKACNLDPTSDNSKLEFFKKKYTFYKEQSQKMINDVYASIVDKYFMKELDELAFQDCCSFDEFLRMNAINNGLTRYTNGENEILKQFYEKYKFLKEKFKERNMSAFETSIKQGEISAESLFICHSIKLTERYDSLKKFKEDLSKIMLPENPELYENFLDSLEMSSSIRNIFDYKFLELETEKGKKKTLFFDERQGNHFTKNTNGIEVIRADEEIEQPKRLFHMTLAYSKDFIDTIKKFTKLKESISMKDPNARIHIVKDILVVTYNSGESLFYIMEDNDFALAKVNELLPESRKSLKVISLENIDSTLDKENNQEREPVIELNTSKNESTSLIPISQNPFMRFFENIKEKITTLFPRKHKNKENEEENKYTSNELTTQTRSNHIDSAEEFSNRLHVDTTGKYNPKASAPKDPAKEKDTNYTK